jgi:hypothetical protein
LGNRSRHRHLDLQQQNEENWNTDAMEQEDDVPFSFINHNHYNDDRNKRRCFFYQCICKCCENETDLQVLEAFLDEINWIITSYQRPEAFPKEARVAVAKRNAYCTDTTRSEWVTGIVQAVHHHNHHQGFIYDVLFDDGTIRKGINNLTTIQMITEYEKDLIDEEDRLMEQKQMLRKRREVDQYKWNQLSLSSVTQNWERNKTIPPTFNSLMDLEFLIGKGYYCQWTGECFGAPDPWVA